MAVRLLYLIFRLVLSCLQPRQRPPCTAEDAKQSRGVASDLGSTSVLMLVLAAKCKSAPVRDHSVATAVARLRGPPR